MHTKIFAADHGQYEPLRRAAQPAEFRRSSSMVVAKNDDGKIYNQHSDIVQERGGGTLAISTPGEIVTA
jgi:hypothetical protein